MILLMRVMEMMEMEMEMKIKAIYKSQKSQFRQPRCRQMEEEFITPEKQLFVEIQELIAQSRQQVAIAVNSALAMLYWQIGTRINEEVEGKNRTEMYGKEIVISLTRQ